jgi:hypothetical protein
MLFRIIEMPFVNEKLPTLNPKNNYHRINPLPHVILNNKNRTFAALSAIRLSALKNYHEPI